VADASGAILIKGFETMKTSLLVAFLLSASTVFAANGGTTYTVREFAKNASAQDWNLELGWSWTDGVLTHAPGIAADEATQAVMPVLTAGRLYRVDVTFAGRTKGSVTVGLGNAYDAWLGRDGSYSLFIWPNDPQGLLTFIATRDYDGVISKIRVVELGDELVTTMGWTVGQGWSQAGGKFRHAPGSSETLERTVGVQAGHTYRLYFNVHSLSNGYPNNAMGTVALAGDQPHPFNQNGNYAFDIRPTQDGGRLVFGFEDHRELTGVFDGTISLISVREITSDAVQSQTGGTQK
jgi:hypothetical protein